MKRLFILLTILLLAISCSNGSTNPGDTTKQGRIVLAVSKYTAGYLPANLELSKDGGAYYDAAGGSLSLSDLNNETGDYRRTYYVNPGVYKVRITYNGGTQKEHTDVVIDAGQEILYTYP
ncbi:hypothetical protein [Brachyspira pulli]|uniref:hypothetical protein n=1 Tax=Brachyspira pulli TaxID=310721 RepID=UPI003004B4E9